MLNILAEHEALGKPIKEEIGFGIVVSPKVGLWSINSNRRSFVHGGFPFHCLTLLRST